MKLTKENLRKALVSPGHISEDKFNTTLDGLEENAETLEKVLVEKGLITSDRISQAIASAFNYISINLNEVAVSENVKEIIPEVVARAQLVVALDQTEDTLRIVMADPDNYEFINFLQKKTGKKIQIYYATPMSLDRAFRVYEGNLQERVEKTIEQIKKIMEEGDGSFLEGRQEGVVDLVNLFLVYARTNKASDIHIEPFEEDVVVRFRIDGVLHEVASYPRDFHDKIVSRVKILAKLRTDERAATQDGRFTFGDKKEGLFDVRVSIVPATKGENVVLRLLSKDPNIRSLEALGLSEKDLVKVVRASERPHGMMLAVGPTGSGKTTTLYTILQKLNSTEVNIMTIEDPVEYEVDRVQQIQVNLSKDITFAAGLRSLVRQDPDIIMVGEIRDNETADIAVNAAMTGHLLLSTLHTNDAVTTFPRLVEMGIEPFLVASSVSVIVAQRLVRKICNTCKASFLPDENVVRVIQSDPVLEEKLLKISGKGKLSDVRLYKGVGCEACGNTGFIGRVGIFEVLEVTDAIRPLIINKQDPAQIERVAKEEGMITMFEDGLAKALQGTTTIEEVVRVIKI